MRTKFLTGCSITASYQLVPARHSLLVEQMKVNVVSCHQNNPIVLSTCHMPEEEK